MMQYERIIDVSVEGYDIIDRLEEGIDVLADQYKIELVNFKSRCILEKPNGLLIVTGWSISFEYDECYSHLFNDTMVLMHA